MLLLLLLACSDYAVSGRKDEPGRGDRPPKDGPAADTGDLPAPDDGSGDGEGTVPDDGDGCEGTRTVRLGLAADDVWTAWIDGNELGTAEHWWEATWFDLSLDCGPHVLAVYATDAHQAISGFVAAVEVDGALASVTGDGSWKVTAGHGAQGWHGAGFDDSGWGTGVPCEQGSATSWWGGSPEDLRALGAWWIWSGECLALGDASFRLTFDVR